MIEESLPGTFLAYEGIEYAAVKQGNTPINVAVEGIRTGKFTLNVRARTGAGQVKEIRYNEVPVELGTLATLTFTPLSAADPPKLMVTTGGVTTTVEPKIGSANERPETPSAPPAGPAEIPSVRGTVGSFRFFSGDGENITPLGLRKYETSFARGSMKAVYFELTINYADIDSSANYNLTAVWTRDGKPFARQDVPMTKPANWNIGTKTYGYGFPNSELWQPGTYTVELTVEGKRIALGTFVVN
jgi:hypothetical protein